MQKKEHYLFLAVFWKCEFNNDDDDNNNNNNFINLKVGPKGKKHRNFKNRIMKDLNSVVSIITLILIGPSTSVKEQRLSDWRNKMTQLIIFTISIL